MLKFRIVMTNRCVPNTFIMRSSVFIVLKHENKGRFQLL